LLLVRGKIRRACVEDAKVGKLLDDPHFAGMLESCQQALRREVVARAVLHGVPARVHEPAGLLRHHRAQRLFANVLLAQRDDFGARKYERLDRARASSTRTGRK
jgi:6-phosphogluconate dehydrogenase